MSNDYGFRATLNIPYEAAIEKATAALKAEGFGVLTEIDVQATLKQKIGADFRRYIILGACNPNLAHQALQSELEVGLLLPCNVIVYETDEGQSTVSFIDPMAMLGVVEGSGLQPIANEAKARLSHALDSLTKDNE